MHMTGEHHESNGSCNSGDCSNDHDHDHGSITGVGLLFAIVAAIALALSWLLSLVPETSFPSGVKVSQFGYWIAFFFGGFFAAIDTVKSLAKGRLTIDTLMIAAGIGAAFIGHLPEGALLLTLFSIGHAAEHHAMHRAERSIEALASLRPTIATRIDPKTNETNDVSISEIELGDTVLIRPDSRLPVDGVVVAGYSSVDQSPITGESIPVDKSPFLGFVVTSDNSHLVPKEHQVFAGTINGSGSMNVQVTRRSDDSTLSRVVRLIADTKAQRSPTQRLTDRFERLFVPAVLGFVGLLLFAFLIVDEPFSRSLYRAMAVLVAASPCALAIATPSAVLSAIARAGHDGVLIKGGGPLEQLGKVDSIAFDKTGTLTSGRPQVVDAITMPDVNRSTLLGTAAAVQRVIDHPLARAIVRTYDAENSTSDPAEHVVSDVQRINGKGVVARLNGRLVSVGSVKLFSGLDGDRTRMSLEGEIAAKDLMNRGRTIVIVADEVRLLGVIGLVDTPRPAAKSIIEKLRKIGVRQQVMLSGDHQAAVLAIATELKLDDAKGDLMPEDKVLFINEMSRHGVTAMVGDGANDAPAMAAASVSIAMGAAGSDVALETADVALMGDDLTKLPFAISLGQAANRVIRQNLFISLGVIAFLVPATLLGLKLGPAVVLHEGSTLVVVANALRLLGFRTPQ